MPRKSRLVRRMKTSLILPPIPLMLPPTRHRRKRASMRSISMRNQLRSTNTKSMGIRRENMRNILTNTLRITKKVMTHINKRSTRSLLKITLTNMKMILRNKKRKQQQRPIVWLKRLKKRPRSKLIVRGSLMRRKRGLSTRSS